MKKTRRLLSLLLAVLMLTCCIPLSAWAAEETADPTQSNAPYAWPLPSSGAITQGYSSDEHQALDIAIEEGTPVLAAESGTVVHTQVWDGVTMDGDQSYGQYGHAFPRGRELNPVCAFERDFRFPRRRGGKRL